MKRSFLWKLLLFPALVLGSSMWNLACDSTALITPVRVAFDRMQVVSATPVKQATTSTGDTVWVPACGTDSTHLRINFNLKSTPRETDDGLDNDLQIRPDDLVNAQRVVLGSTISESSFDLDLTCVSAHDGDDTAGACTGVDNPTAGVVPTGGLQFVDHYEGQGRGTPVGVAILIDQSGSTSGKVDATQPPGSLQPACLEGKSGSISFPNPLTECASDPRNFRLSAARNLINTLNAEDRHIVFGYNGQNGVQVACGAPGLNEPWNPSGATASEAAKQANCYTTDKRFTLGESGNLNWQSAITGQGGLQGQGTGRSNLWTALKTSIDFMAGQGAPSTRHIVVFADGPDTCTPSSIDYQHCFGGQAQDACPNSVDYEAAKQALVDAQGAGQDIHVSFIHLQSIGYRQSDPRMQEIACLSGGHYQFINGAKLSYDQGEQQGPMDKAVEKLRLTFGGHYGLVVDVPTLTQAPGNSATAQALGAVYAISGSLQLLSDETSLVRDPRTPISFSFGPPDLPGNFDGRLQVHRPCSAASDCALAGGECGIGCDDGTRLCTAPAQGSACPGGVCCDGQCAAGQTLCQSATDPLACP